MKLVSLKALVIAACLVLTAACVSPTAERVAVPQPLARGFQNRVFTDAEGKKHPFVDRKSVV